MSTKYNVLIMGASYGSLLASKLLLSGHTVKLVCLPAEVELINSDGIRVRSRAPRIGEHDDEVYGELGLSADERATLRGEGVIRDVDA